MSFDIDMKNFMGAPNDSAATNQPIDDRNFYHQEASEPPVYDEAILKQIQAENVDSVSEQSQPPEVNPQAEHFRSLREEVDRIKAEREAEKREHQMQIDMLRANMQAQNQPKQAEVQAKQMFEGMKDDDVPNVAEFRREWEQREAVYQAKLEELEVQQAHPDYAEVIEKFTIPLVRNKPHLAEGLRGATNKALFAYELGAMAKEMQSHTQQHVAPAPPQKSETAQRIVDNARKPGTLSQAGGQGTLSQADYFATMSDKEFIAFAQRNLDAI